MAAQYRMLTNKTTLADEIIEITSNVQKEKFINSLYTRIVSIIKQCAAEGMERLTVLMLPGENRKRSYYWYGPKNGARWSMFDCGEFSRKHVEELKRKLINDGFACSFGSAHPQDDYFNTKYYIVVDWSRDRMAKSTCVIM
jgi:hypothetical protein